jgi:branched-chain amino acid transport system substrate-binding protein
MAFFIERRKILAGAIASGYLANLGGRFAGALVAGLVATASVTASAQSDRPMKIGALLGLSGLGSQIGQWIVNGAEIASEQLAASGGQKFTIIAEDSQWNPQKGVEGFNKLVNVDKVDVLLSGGSSVMQAIAPMADERKLLLMNVGAQSPNMAGIGKFTFSAMQLSDFDTSVLAKYAYGTLKYRKIATLYVNNDTGKFNQAALADFFKAAGGTITAQEAFKSNETNYGVQIAKIRATSPDAIYVVGTPAELPFAVKQVRQFAPKVPVLSYAAVESKEFLTAAGDSANDIVYTTTAFDPDSKEPMVMSFAKAYEAKYKEKPTSPYIGYGYDAVMIIAQALKQDGGATGEALRAKIYSIRRFPGIMGENVFRDDGTVAKDIAVRKIDGGVFKTITVVKP